MNDSVTDGLTDSNVLLVRLPLFSCLPMPRLDRQSIVIALSIRLRRAPSALPAVTGATRITHSTRM